MLNWMNWRRQRDRNRREPDVEPRKRPVSVMLGKYLSLHTYLANRYADTVVLTFEQIESLLGFALPESARLRQDWWSNSDAATNPPGHREAWIKAQRTATPNLLAQTVVFDRIS